MQRFFRKCRCLSLVCASIVAILWGVACSGTAPSFSIFNQRPQQGSGAAITLQTADHIHLLWSDQPRDTVFGGITSTKGIVYVSYASNTSSVGKGESVENFNQPDHSGAVSVLDALDSRSGHRLWQFQALDELPDFAARPLVVANTIYLAFTSHVCALNAQTGGLRWCSAVIDRENDAEYLLDGEMASENGLLFLGAYHTFIAVNATTGKRMWSAPIVMRGSHLVAGNDMVYVSAVGGKLVAFDARSGKPVWQSALPPDAYDPDDPSGNYAPVPLLGGGVLSILTGRRLVAFQGSSGDLLWQVQVILDGEYQLEEPPFPVVENLGGTAYVVALVETATSSQVTTELVAYNLHTHQQAWREQVEGAGTIPQALEVSSGVVYAASLQNDGSWSPQPRWHFWLSMVGLHSGQVVRQLQNNDSSFRVDQLVGGDGRLYVSGVFPDFGQERMVYALGN